MESFKAMLRSEFRLKQFGFSTIIYDRIFFSQWRLPPLIILIYKGILAIYVDFWLIFTASRYAEISVGGSSFIAWPAWLTNWTYTLLALHLTMSAVGSLVYHLVRARHSQSWLCSRATGSHWSLVQEIDNRGEINEEPYDMESSGQPAIMKCSSAPWYVAIFWILNNMALVATPIVSLMFFVFLWPNIRSGSGIDIDNLQLHGLNSVCIVIDFILSPYPVRILHFIYPLIYGLIYVIFSAIYWAGDHGRVLYPGILDWNNAGKTVGMVFLVVLFLIIVQLIFFGLHKLKAYIYMKMYSSDYYESISN